MCYYLYLPDSCYQNLYDARTQLIFSLPLMEAYLQAVLYSISIQSTFGRNIWDQVKTNHWSILQVKFWAWKVWDSWPTLRQNLTGLSCASEVVISAVMNFLFSLLTVCLISSSSTYSWLGHRGNQLEGKPRPERTFNFSNEVRHSTRDSSLTEKPLKGGTHPN